MKVLKALCDKPKVMIRDLLHKRMTRTDTGRTVEVTHASDLTSETYEYCPREVALRLLCKRPAKTRVIGTSLQATFHMGWALQAAVADEWLRDIVVGDWGCQSCGGSRTMCQAPRGHCGRSGVTCRWHYKEVRLVDKDLGLTCGIDLLVDVGALLLRLVEVKTMIKDQWKKLAAPLSEHRLRTQLYLWLVSRSSLAKQVDTSMASVLYIAKSYGGNTDGQMTPFKEYFVQNKVGPHLEELLNRAAVAQRYRVMGAIPCGICTTAMNGRAKSCSVISQCFGGKYPGQTTWLREGSSVCPGREVVSANLGS